MTWVSRARKTGKQESLRKKKKKGNKKMKKWKKRKNNLKDTPLSHVPFVERQGCLYEYITGTAVF